MRPSPVPSALPGGSPTLAGGRPVRGAGTSSPRLERSDGEIRLDEPERRRRRCARPPVAKGEPCSRSGPASAAELFGWMHGAAQHAGSAGGRQRISPGAQPARSRAGAVPGCLRRQGNEEVLARLPSPRRLGKRVWERAPVGSSELFDSSSPVVANGVVTALPGKTHIRPARLKREETLVEDDRDERVLAGGGRRGRVLRRRPDRLRARRAHRQDALAWTHTADPSDPAVTGGTLYIGSGDGVTRAYRLPAG